MDRRTMLKQGIAASVPILIPRLARAGILSSPRQILLRSAWQAVNIGDIGHTPGAIEIIRRSLPDCEITLWPSLKGLEPEVRRFLDENYPFLRFAEGSIVDGRPSTESLAQAFQKCDFLLHSSGSGFPARADVGEWARLTGKPYGIFPISLDPVSGFGPGRNPEGGTLSLLRRESLSPGKYPLDEKTRKVIDGAAFMFCRDSISENYLRLQGVKTPKLLFGPDTQFGMSATDNAYAESFCRDNRLVMGKFICIVPRLRYTPHTSDARFDEQKHEINEQAVDRDMGKLRQVIAHYLENTNGKVLICPEMTYELALGKERLYDPLSALAKQRVVWQPHFWLPNQAAGIYARSQAVVSCECHSPIISVIHLTPTLYLRQPTDTCKGEMYADLGLGNWIREIDETSGGAIWQWLENVLRSPAEARSIAHAAMQRVQRDQAIMGETLARTLSSTSNR